ncbi:MAG: hypothetical protein ACPGUD_08590 [Parashewanella sp.]
MIIFTLDSIESAFTLLSQQSKLQIDSQRQEQVYFNDGTELLSVTHLLERKQDFEVDGIFESHLVGFEIVLRNDKSIKADKTATGYDIVSIDYMPLQHEHFEFNRKVASYWF